MFRSFAVKIFVCISCIIHMYNAYALPLDPFEVRQAPIAEFIDWVSKQSGENIILGRGVEGTVSVHVKTMDSKDVIPLFIQVMNSNGYMVDLDKNGFYKVLIDKDKTVKPAQIFTKVYKLNYLRNTKAREIFNSVLLAASNDNRDTQIQETDEKPIATIAVSTHSVDVLPASNALLVSGTENQIKIMDRFVSEIDTDIKQVLIEAVIMETDIGGSESIGINLSNAVRESGLNLISNTINSVSSLTGIAEGGHVVFSKDSDIRALISAIARNSHSKILSTPNIVVLDREKGHISVGQNVPFLTSREVTDGGNTIQQIERKDVGITLSVSPHVLESGQVVLQINQESSSVTNSSLAADIITNKRSISTVAQVRDGETIALGGLVSDETRTVESGIPGLRHIPWLGRLFRYDSEETVQRELTVMIKTLIL